MKQEELTSNLAHGLCQNKEDGRLLTNLHYRLHIVFPWSTGVLRSHFEVHHASVPYASVFLRLLYVLDIQMGSSCLLVRPEIETPSVQLSGKLQKASGLDVHNLPTRLPRNDFG